MSELVLNGRARRSPLYANMTSQVLLALAAGILVGWLFPGAAGYLKPLGDVFVRMVKMVIGPIIFLTVVTGISGMGDLKKVGKIGLITVIYFEIITTIGLLLGLVAVNVFRPGDGFTPTASVAAQHAAGRFAQSAREHSIVQFLVNIVPDNIVTSFAKLDALQILFFSILFGAALITVGEKARPVSDFLERLSVIMFGIIRIVTQFAPIGAFGAIGFTVGTFGIAALRPLALLVGAVYVTFAVFVLVVLGATARLYGFGILRFLRFIKDEIFLTLGTFNSEVALPRLLEKMQKLGCPRAVVGLVVPTGYTMNQDGTMVYLAMAVGFIAQAYNIPLSLLDQASLLLIMMMTSKGVGGVAGAGFVILASTLAATGELPVEGLALLLGVDRFMSVVRALGNVIGNAVACVVVAKIDGDFNEAQAIAHYREVFDNPAIGRL